MVKKLYKHECIAWLRVMTVIWIATLAVAGVHRIIQLFESDTVYYGIVSGSAIFVYAVAVLACMAAPTVFGITRFYRNFFTGEGYLTFTLPVTQRAHLWVKASTAVCFSVVSALVCLMSVMLITAGEMFCEILKAADYLLREIPQELSGHIALYALEYLVLLLVALFASHLLYDTCICIGQLFRKNRILAAVGVYFGLYLISQIFGTVFSVVLVILGEAGVLDQLTSLAAQHPVASVHIALCTAIVLSGLSALVYWLICHGILRRRLNLE